MSTATHELLASKGTAKVIQQPYAAIMCWQLQTVNQVLSVINSNAQQVVKPPSHTCVSAPTHNMSARLLGSIWSNQMAEPQAKNP